MSRDKPRCDATSGGPKCARKTDVTMSNDCDNLENTGSPSERRPSHGADAEVGADRVCADGRGDLPPTERPELAALLRDLDAVGSVRRAQLSTEAEHRIFAASDLLLPLARGEVRPVARRGTPARRSTFRTWVRVAAAIAVVGSITIGAIVLSRGLGGVDGASGGGVSTPGGVIADAGVSPNAGVPANAALPPTMVAAVSPEHFEIALASDSLRRASSLPAPVVVAALESPKRLAYPAIARIDTAVVSTSTLGSTSEVGFDVESLAGIGGIEGLDEAIDLDFDGLSGEFAAIVSRSASGS